MASGVLGGQNFRSPKLLRWPFLRESLGFSVWRLKVSRAVFQVPLLLQHRSLEVEFIKSIGALHQCYQLCSACGFILVLPSSLVCIFREVGHVPHDPPLSMNQSSSQASPSAFAWHFLICLVIRCYLDWSSKERSQQIKNKNSIGDCDQDFHDLGFTTLGSKKLET